MKAVGTGALSIASVLRFLIAGHHLRQIQFPCGKDKWIRYWELPNSTDEGARTMSS